MGRRERQPQEYKKQKISAVTSDAIDRASVNCRHDHSSKNAFDLTGVELQSFIFYFFLFSTPGEQTTNHTPQHSCVHTTSTAATTTTTNRHNHEPWCGCLLRHPCGNYPSFPVVCLEVHGYCQEAFSLCLAFFIDF